ncbi:hypothetical protein TJA_24520 [Thermus sp. LT1-2-5]
MGNPTGPRAGVKGPKSTVGRKKAHSKAWTYLDHPSAFTLIPNPILKQALSGEVGGKRLKPIPRLVYLTLLSRARLEGKEATAQDLALLLGFDPRTVEKALLELWELGLVERGGYGYFAPLRAVLPKAHAVQSSLHAVQGESGEKAVPDELGSVLEEIREEEKKKPPHPLSHPPTPPSAEGEEELWEEPLAEPLGEGHEVEASLAFPPGGSGTSVLTQASPPLVKPGTKSLRAALEGAGLWREFWRVFRPGFATPALFGAYLHRLERGALPLGTAFLEVVARTLEGARRGVVRYPAAYLERLLQELAPEGAQAPSLTSSLEAPPFQDGDLLLLPDGRRGYFGGWTGGGKEAFLEVDGVAYRVPRELLLEARVVG